jgi:hypothetical protein
VPPISITNVLPCHSPQVSLPASLVVTPASCQLLGPTLDKFRHIPGLRDNAVEEYNDWQQSKIHDEGLKVEFEKARDAILMEGLDLEQVHEDQDLDFLV